MQLSVRLRAIAAQVTPGNRLVDVGCDHGYLPIWLLERGRIPSALAADVRPGPLARAKEHIRQHGLENKIGLRLSDGLSGIQPGEGDTLVLAGMGGLLMKRILAESSEKSHSFKELVLQPQSDLYEFRSFLWQEGFCVAAEDLVLEEGKYYFILRAVPGKEKQKPAPWELMAGRRLLREKHIFLGGYLQKELLLRHGILKELEGNGNEGAVRRRKEVFEELLIFARAWEEYRRPL